MSDRGAKPGGGPGGRAGAAGAGAVAQGAGAASAPYAGNADAAAIAARLRGAKSAIVITHAKPDGDAIGSVLAVLRMLRAHGAEARAWLVGPIDHSLRSFVAHERFGDPLRETPPAPGSADDPDLVVVVDTGSWSQLDALADWVRARSAKTILVDHHRGGDPAVAALRLIDAGCASTTQCLLRVVDALGVDLRHGSAPGPGAADSIAEALYLGLATDTGWFRFSNAGAAVFEAAARLLRAGVEKDRLYRQVEETARPERMKLLARALASLELRGGGRAALMTLTSGDFAASGGGPEDLSGIINEPMAIGRVDVSALVTESDGGTVKLSFRSKPPLEPGGPFVDVNAFAARYGGGGHVQAAGARVREPLAEVLDRVKRDLDALA